MKSQRGSFVLGLIVGLLVGLSVALGVALYITKAPVPFINKVPQRGADQDAAEAARNKDWDPNAPLAGKNPARGSAAVTSGVVGSAAPAASAVATGPAAAPTAAPSAAAKGTRDPAAILTARGAASAARGAASAAKSTAAGAEALLFFVQAGAYSRAEDAEQQRAKLALMGLDARVSEREQSGRTVHRVRLGPFDRRDQAEGIQSRLSETNVESTLVRMER